MTMEDFLDLDTLTQLLDEDVIEDTHLQKENNHLIKEDLTSEDQLKYQPPGSTQKQGCTKNQIHSDGKSTEQIENELLKMQEQMKRLQEELKKKKSQTETSKDVASSVTAHSEQSSHKGTVQEVDIFAHTPTSLRESQTQLKGTENNAKVIGKSNSIKDESLQSSDDEGEYLTAEGRMIKRRLAHPPKYDVKDFLAKKQVATWKTPAKKQLTIKELNSSACSETEFFSGLKIINPLIPLSTVQSRMEGRRMVRMSLINCIAKGGDIEGDWVTMGVIVGKVPPKTSKSGKTFSIWKMSDLRDCSKLVSMFLFGDVHQKHWKTSIGTVVGFLNPTILPNKDDSKFSDISLSIDHPGKVMLIGTSKDLGFCKSRKKNGEACGALVNLSVCDVCDYHVQARYKKLSSRRPDLQGTFSGIQPRSSLKEKILTQQQIMYGGHVYVSPSVRTDTVKKMRGQKLIFESLKLQHRAKEFEKTGNQPPALDKAASPESVLKPKSSSLNSPSSTSLVPTSAKSGFSKAGQNIVSVTTKELMKIHQKSVSAKQNLVSRPPLPPSPLTSKDPISPKLGRGILPGQDVCFNVMPSSTKVVTSKADVAKSKAIQKIKSKGLIKQNDPNAVKKRLSQELQEKIRKRVEDTYSKDSDDSEVSDQPLPKRICLGKMDINSENLEKILKRKSSHSFEVEQDELEKQEKYFDLLEKKEQMENKMGSIKELECDVISCKECRYTAYQASDLCKQENHVLVRHKATKKFFRCTVCSHRTFAFTRLPTKACRQCGEAKFERTTMMKPRQGPKLESETLLIRGEEVKFLNS